MKDISTDYIEKEEASTKQPVELFHFWRDGGQHWRYTSGDTAVIFDAGDGSGPWEYSPATLQRSLVKYNAQLEVTACQIQAGYVEDPALRFIAVNPIEILWVEIMRLHRDMLPLEADVIFIGQVKGVSFQGIQAQADCVGFENFLSMPIPTFRYSITCNWKLFESRTIAGYTIGCKLVKADYKVEVPISLDATGRILTAAAFDVGDGWWTLGTVEYEGEKRTVVAHAGDSITIAYPMEALEDGDTPEVYPGCDCRPTTCRDKFDNVENSLWFAFIPGENPAIRTP